MVHSERSQMLVLTVLAMSSFLAVPRPAPAASVIGWGRQAGNSSHGKCTAIAAGSLHTLALTANGAVVARGDNFYAQAAPPAGEDFAAIAAGANHSLALKADGSIVAWGRNNHGQATPPAGTNHSLALKADGSIVAWGSSDFGLDTAPTETDFVEIAAGNYHNLARKTDGSIVAWGQNNHDLLEPPPENNFIAVAAGELHDLALRRHCRYLLAGDLDNDCTVNLADVAKMASNWLVNCYHTPNNAACIPK